MPKQLAHAVLKEVEYIDIRKSGLRLKTYGKEVEGFKWRKFQELVGKDLGDDKFTYTFKKKDHATIYNGQINGINLGSKKMEVVKADPGLEHLSSSIEEINKRLDKTEGGMGFEMVITSLKTMHESHVSILNGEITRRDVIITKQENKIDSLESELDSIDTSQGEPNVMQYIKIVREIMEIKSGKGTPVESLAASDQSDVPPKLLELIGMVDWLQVSLEVQEEIVKYLRLSINKLPMKGH